MEFIERESGYFWVCIGDFGTPQAIETDLKDEFMAKQSFITYRDILKNNGLNINQEDVVLVINYVEDCVIHMKPEIFFEGNYIDALAWSENSCFEKD